MQIRVLPIPPHNKRMLNDKNILLFTNSYFSYFYDINNFIISI